MAVYAAAPGSTCQDGRGHGRSLRAVGRAGAGKSRLMYDFKQLSPTDAKCWTRNSSRWPGSAWLPGESAAKSFRRSWPTRTTTSPSEKVEAKARRVSPGSGGDVSLILSLAGHCWRGAALAMIYAQIRRRLTLEAIKRILIQESLQATAVLIFRDLTDRPGDPGASDLVVDAWLSARILMFVTPGPSYRHDWGNRPTCYKKKSTPCVSNPLGGRAPTSSSRATRRGFRPAVLSIS